MKINYNELSKIDIELLNRNEIQIIDELEEIKEELTNILENEFFNMLNLINDDAYYNNVFIKPLLLINLGIDDVEYIKKEINSISKNDIEKDLYYLDSVKELRNYKNTFLKCIEYHKKQYLKEMEKIEEFKKELEENF